MTQTEIVKSRKQLLKIITDCEKEVLNVAIIYENALYVEWKYIEAAVISSPYTNVVLGAYVTALGRLHLYSILEKLNERCLYFDTGKIYILKKSNNLINLILF